MLPPQQQIFNKVFEVCLSLGFKTFDFLPADGEEYPFVFVGEQSDVDRANKSTVTGLVMQTVHFYGDYRKRGDLSIMMNDLKRELRKVKHTKNFYINVKNINARTLPDNTTARRLIHGIAEVEFSFN